MANKVIISGGGTGGHIFPAIAIANALRKIQPGIEILFVGALGKMEMEKVPAAGYQILGLDIQGINRLSLLKNALLPFKMVKSLLKSRKIIKEFNADVAIGVGGYASGPLLMMANMMDIPTLIQEQNSFAGKTNISLGKRAKRVCVAYEGMEKFFPASKIVLTGNPIRHESVNIQGKREQALASFGLELNKKTILVTGGSLGAGTLNDCIKLNLQKLDHAGVQVIWQCGGYYFDRLTKEIGDNLPSCIKLMPFVQDMSMAYAACDLTIARAGAGTISELCIVGKPAVLVPSPSVAEDHQTKNALSLVNKSAAIMIKDQEAREVLVDNELNLLQKTDKIIELGKNIKELALQDADEVIAKEVLSLIK